MYKDYKIIALCISKVHTKINLSLVTALNRKLTPMGYRLLIFHTSTDLYRGSLNDTAEKTIFDLIPYNIVDTVIIHDDSFYDKWMIQSIIDRCNHELIPVINIGDKHVNCYNVAYEEDAGFKKIIDHIIHEHKATDIYMISGYKGVDFSDRREQIFEDVLRANGLPYGPDHIYYGELWQDPTEKAVESILSSGHLPQALVCVNDYTAITACEVLKAHNIRIPEDIMIFGFDGIDESTYCTPSITTCGNDPKHIADVVAQIVHSTEKQTTTPFVSKINYELRLGGSCGCGSNIRYAQLGALLKSSDDRLNGYIDFEGHLYELGEKLILSQSAEEQAMYLKNLRILNCAIMMNKDFMDSTINPIDSYREDPFDKELQVIYQNGVIKETSRQDSIYSDLLVPGLDDILETERPILFNTLSYLGQPMGYICFYFELDPNDYCHIVQYVTMLNQAFGGSHNVKYLHHIAHSMESMSEHDFLTKLLNRKGFYRELEDFLKEQPEDTTIMVASIDLDGLKYINDNYGHTAGDTAIKLAAEAIDNIPIVNKLSARFGGDEFVLVAPLTLEMDMQAIENSLNNNLDILQELNATPFAVTTSFGGVLSTLEDFDFEIILRASDEKMYNIKKAKPHSRR